MKTWVDPIKAPPGMFWCRGHLTDQLLVEQSDDPRYCRGCCEFLLNEAALLPAKRRGIAAWVPVPKAPEALSVNKSPSFATPDKGNVPVGVLQHTGGRPQKEGKVHRTTEWRRKKGKQGVSV